MVFSSAVFLFLYLPIVLGLHQAAPKSWRNLLLLAASLLFYAWGAKLLVLVMLASIGANWALGLWVDRVRNRPLARWVVALAVALNLAPLLYFKYTHFLAEILRTSLMQIGLEIPRLQPIELPIGISFFTFQAMSYVIDVYRRQGEAQRNPLDVALYVALFPQLIAGPIVRYCDVARQIVCRQVTVAGFAEGVQRFLLGLAKKLLIANSVAPVADAVFDIPDGGLSTSVAWLGVICYTLQIYFDFSGYSDMAIGLGLMFGFRFVENFNYPYIARSVTDFWRRWHISLSTWFRDYLYIPLGGNRGPAWQTYRNLLLVFLLCGLWHGASWNFAAWGLFHGAFLILERRGLARLLERLPAGISHAYTLLAVMVGWVFFRATSLTHVGAVLSAMAGLRQPTDLAYPLELYFDNALVLVMAAGMFGSLPWLPTLVHWLSALPGQAAVRPRTLALAMATTRLAATCLLLAAAAIVLSASTYNPFIYFQF